MVTPKIPQLKHPPKENTELKVSASLTSDYTTKIQSSKQYGHGKKNKSKQKYRSMEQNRKPRKKIHRHVVNQFMTKEARLYNREKRAFSINGASKLELYM